MRHDDDEPVVGECPSRCRWGWLRTERVVIDEDRDITEADVITHVEFSRRMKIRPTVKPCNDPECTRRES